jgi:hypothetical protein
MFERFSEKARRAIFFGRYEASKSGSERMEPEHLLLGLIREEQGLGPELSRDVRLEIRKRVESRIQPTERISTSVDLPFSPVMQRILARAIEEAEQLHASEADSGHLLLAILRSESLAAAILRDQGLRYDTCQGTVRSLTHIDPESVDEAADLDDASFSISPAAGAVRTARRKLKHLVEGTGGKVSADESYGDEILKRRRWSRKQAMGHLVDWACAYQQWMTWALHEKNIRMPGYPSEEWVKSPRYAGLRWRNLVELWIGLNYLLLDLTAQISEDKLSTPCRIGVADPVPLSHLIVHYVERVEEIAGEILTRPS